MSLQMYQLKISIMGIKPTIWRRVLIPAACTLDKLHDAIQIAFGWDDCHLHGFDTGEKRYMPAKHCEAAPFFGEPDLPEEKCTLAEALPVAGAKIRYTYDYGDDWHHLVVLEDAECEAPEGRVCCSGGARACPPEDCGGPWGYETFCEAMKNPKHPEHEDLIEWFGGKYDPKTWDMDRVNTQLARRIKLPKKTAAKKTTKKTVKPDVKKATKKKTDK